VFIKHRPPTTYFASVETSKPRSVITTEKISILHRYFEKLEKQQQQQQHSDIQIANQQDHQYKASSSSSKRQFSEVGDASSNERASKLAKLSSNRSM
jgi:hypothetical protein